ncbi:MAG: DUF599 domain-containing protein [Burkholderiales bacterium]|nr:DUF599 domain-containing protein [Burkholderiales bacterium]
MILAWRGFRFEAIDLLALAWFFSIWIGYADFARRRSQRVPSLMSVMREYRREWWARIVEREMRIVDTSIAAHLGNSATFFASTTLLILGGLLALLGTTDKVVAVVEGLPFNARASPELWEIKILLLIGIFVYAFFKFTWSLRQFNFTSVLIGAAPREPQHTEAEQLFITRAAQLVHSASESFNYGLRAYYFGLAALTWFVSSGLFMIATAWIVGVLYWREFHSETLNLLKRP